MTSGGDVADEDRPARPRPAVRAACLAIAGAALLGSLLFLLFGGHRGAGIAMAGAAVLLTRLLVLNVAGFGRP